MSSPVAIYSLPDTHHFYQVQGPAVTITPEEVYQNRGFIFAPFDPSTEPIYRINGHPEKIALDIYQLQNWQKKNREVNRTLQSTYESMFRKAINAIKSGKMDKIVISIREINHNQLPSYTHFLQQLRNSYPGAFVYLFYFPDREFWIGASPELLLDTNYPFQRTMALAGTRIEAPQLEHWPQKEREEHRYVERYIEEVLEEYSYRKEGPTPILAGPVYHLKSSYFLNIQGSALKPFDLHPGPALSGYPVQPAIEAILNIEPSPRRYYTGFLGPVWEENHSRFYINLRCLEILQDYHVLYAGGGLTHDSNSQTEWTEIQDKLSTLRSKF